MREKNKEIKSLYYIKNVRCVFVKKKKTKTQNVENCKLHKNNAIKFNRNKREIEEKSPHTNKYIVLTIIFVKEN